MSSQEGDQYFSHSGSMADPSRPTDDRENLLDSEKIIAKTIRKPTRCGGCTVYVEPLMFMLMLSQFPLFLLTPQYVLMRELEKFQGNVNITPSTNSCKGSPHHHNGSGMEEYDPVRGNYTLAQSAASLYQLQAAIALSVPGIFVALFLGPYSDKQGRKYAIIPPLIGSIIASVNSLLNVYFHWPVELLLVGQFIYGCCGSWVTLFMGSLSFITDVTTKEDRQFRIVISEICMFAPGILGAAGSGFWVNSLGYTMVYFIVSIMSVLLLLYAIFVIPETVIPDPKAKFLPHVYMKKALTVFLIDDETKRRWKLLTLLTALFFSLLVALGANIDTLFFMNYPLCWGSEIIGINTSVNMAVSVVGSAIIAKILSCFVRDAWIAVVGGVMNIAKNIFIFFVTTTVMMFAASAFSVTSILLTPTLRAMFSKLVKPNEVGAVFSGIAVAEQLCGLVGGVIFNPIYARTQAEGHPSMVFLVNAGFYAIGTVIMISYAILTRNGATQKEERLDEVEQIPDI